MSVLDNVLTQQERQVLQAYRNPDRDFGRSVRISIQYAIATAFFVYLAIYDDARWTLVVYGVFLAWLVARLIRGRAVAGIMPGIIEKYEQRIQQLEHSAGRQPE